MLTEIPTYLNYVMKFNIKEVSKRIIRRIKLLKTSNNPLPSSQNALLSSVPYLVMFILSLSLSFVSDYLLNRKVLSVSQCRKIFNSIGLYLPMIALIGLGYVSQDAPGTAIILLILSVGLNGAIYVGFMVRKWI